MTTQINTGNSSAVIAFDGAELKSLVIGGREIMWCGDPACEEAFKEKAGVTSRCMPFEQEHLDDVCACCGKPAKAMVYWGKAY